MRLYPACFTIRFNMLIYTFKICATWLSLENPEIWLLKDLSTHLELQMSKIENVNGINVAFL